MPKPSLAAALNAALAARPGRPAVIADLPSAAVAVEGDVLLSALRNSTTGRDQIMQRRIGMFPDEGT
jgi:hypothetical protein